MKRLKEKKRASSCESKYYLFVVVGLNYWSSDMSLYCIHARREGFILYLMASTLSLSLSLFYFELPGGRIYPVG
jgi:hypothetical protein